jgi:hypothetical protein
MRCNSCPGDGNPVKLRSGPATVFGTKPQMSHWRKPAGKARE